jgi:hypothetical protein
LDQTACCANSFVTPIRIDAFYLDAIVCERCRNTLSSLNDALELLKPILDLAGIPFTVHRVHIDSLALAKRHRFVSSPTVRVNGVDVAEELTENPCLQCGELCGDHVTCRTFTYHGKTTTELPVGLIVEAVLRAWLAPTPTPPLPPYEVPENLLRFFHAKP